METTVAAPKKEQAKKTQPALVNFREIAESQGTVYYLDPRQIEVVPDLNRRVDYGDMPSLREQIKESGVKVPLTVFQKDGKIFLSQGHRRLQAVLDLIKAGSDIKSIPCLTEKKGYSDESRLVDQILCNDGKPFTPLEEAHVIDQLLTWKWTPKDVAAKLGRTQGHVSNMMVLAQLPKEIQKLIEGDKIAASLAIEICRDVKGDSEKLVSAIRKTVEKAQEEGGSEKKATKKHAKAAGAASDKKDGVVKTIALAISAIKGGKEEELTEALKELQFLYDTLTTKRAKKAKN